MAQRRTRTTAPAKAETKDLSTNVASLAKYAGKGFEGADKDSFAIPFLTILQSGSPQCKRSDGAYIKGAEEGMLYNTVTNEIFDGDEGIEVIPCAFHRAYIQWAADRGGYRGEHLPEELPDYEMKEDDEGRKKMTMANGDTLSDTRHHYCLMRRPDGGYDRIVVAMAKTQVRKSKKWMSLMNNQTFEHAGKLMQAPSFAFHYRLTTAAESNDQGSWFGWAVQRTEPVEDDSVLEAAYLFNQTIGKGEARPNYDSLGDAEGTAADDTAY